MIRYLRVYFLCDNATSLPLMIFCMQKAFAGFDIELKPSDINAYRGLEKRDAIKQMLGGKRVWYVCAKEGKERKAHHLRSSLLTFGKKNMATPKQ
eukprot:m.142702 g.142702  ORF g.142702 m.142702 type:complete len:95 (+) comp24191_c0_seq8:70-354(+)